MGYLDFLVDIRGMHQEAKKDASVYWLPTLHLKGLLCRFSGYVTNYVALFAINFKKYCIWEPNTGQNHPKYPRKGRIQPFAVNTGPVISSGWC